MSITKTFDLIQLVSLLNDELYLEVSKNDIQQIVAHVCGQVEIESQHYEFAKRETADFIAEHHPRLVEAAVIVEKNKNFTQSHYNSLINLFRMRHDIGQMTKVAVPA